MNQEVLILIYHCCSFIILVCGGAELVRKVVMTNLQSIKTIILSYFVIIFNEQIEDNKLLFKY